MRLANKLTVLRILLVPVFVICIVYYQPGNEKLRIIALCLFALAVLTDFGDGIIARAKGEKTKLGSILDPLADKLLLVSAFISLTQTQLRITLPVWVVIIVISRDIIIILGAAIVQFITGQLEIVPSRLGKLTTFFQMATVISILLNFTFSCFFWYTAVVFTVLSGFDYIRQGNKLLNENK